ncbi:MAG: ATP-grasp domain-containing protein [Bryobacteraceae bacterium]|nr:ATP-grasp domain-containing protein [Bryobacteraceae bacterium]
MARILLVAATTGYQIRSFGDAAAKLGVELTLATDRCHVLEDPWGDSAIPVKFASPEAAAIEGSFDGIVAVGDRPAQSAAAIARRLGLRFHSPESVERARNKHAARCAFQAAGLPTPSFQRIPLDAAPHCRDFPCVLKPLGLSASRGVIRASNPAEFAAAFARIRKLLEEPDIARQLDDADRFIQVEAFIPGREFSIEGLMTNGNLHPLAVFDKPDPLDGPFFEETIYVTPSRESEETQAAILQAVRRGCAALGLSHGPIHAEVRVNENGVWPLEIAPRPIGGLCSQALRFAKDISLQELILRHALGENISGIAREPGASGVMMIPIPRAGVFQDAFGLDDALATPGIAGGVITAKQGQTLRPLPEGASYLGFLFSRAATPRQAENALRDAHAYLRFHIAPMLDVVR